MHSHTLELVKVVAVLNVLDVGGNPALASALATMITNVEAQMKFDRRRNAAEENARTNRLNRRAGD